MTKAIFSEKQPSVTVTELDGMNWFQVCLNGVETETSVSDMEGGENASETAYEYDFNAWHDSTTDPEAVKKNPENYLNYVPSEIPTETAPTLADRVKSLEEQQSVTAQAVQDIILMQEE